MNMQSLRLNTFTDHLVAYLFSVMNIIFDMIFHIAKTI